MLEPGRVASQAKEPISFFSPITKCRAKRKVNSLTAVSSGGVLVSCQLEALFCLLYAVRHGSPRSNPSCLESNCWLSQIHKIWVFLQFSLISSYFYVRIFGFPQSLRFFYHPLRGLKEDPPSHITTLLTHCCRSAKFSLKNFLE